MASRGIKIGFLLALHCSSFLFAQEYGTCEYALAVNSSADVIVNCKGAPDQLCAQYFAQEHNVAWITFVAPKDTILTFDLIPSISTHDLDFLLFVDQGGNFCGTLSPTCPVPVRFNIANPGPSQGGRTGLSVSAENNTELSGNHPAYSKALTVKKGERFYLVVDDLTGPGTFNFYLHLTFPPGKPEKPIQGNSTIDARPVKVPPMKKSTAKSTVVVIVTDSGGNPLKAIVDIYGLLQKKTVTRSFTEDSFALEPSQKIIFNCNAAGYFFSQRSYTAPEDKGRNYITIPLKPIKKGESLVAGGIEFEKMKATLLSSSTATLMNLVSFMRNNPKVNIAIKGYVNDPYGNDPARAKSLSESRAKAVYKYLRDKGINADRLKSEGCGSDNMLYPHPANEEQEQANRRVEITVE